MQAAMTARGKRRTPAMAPQREQELRVPNLRGGGVFKWIVFFAFSGELHLQLDAIFPPLSEEEVEYPVERPRDETQGKVPLAQARAQEHGGDEHTIVQYSTVQYSTVQYSKVQYSTVQYSTVQYSTAARLVYLARCQV